MSTQAMLPFRTTLEIQASEISALIAKVKSRFPKHDTSNKQVIDACKAGVPFVVSCVECGIDTPTSFQDALATGWTSIELVDGESYNFLGYCGECTESNP